MVVPAEPAIDTEDLLGRTYENAVVYADREGETVLYEGDLRLLPDGWVEFETGRLLSPGAVHHIDRPAG